MTMLIGSRIAAALGLIAVAGCDNTPSLGGLSSCQPSATVSIAPTSASIRVADTLRVVASVDGCQSPLLRNDTPTVIRLDSVSAGTFRVTGLSVGNGRVRVLSPTDTTISAAAAITVTP